jgi:hypothetical protein
MTKITESIIAEIDAALRGARSPSGGVAFSGYDREKILGAVVGYAARSGRRIDGRKVTAAIASTHAAEAADRPLFEAAVFGTRAEVEAERAWNERQARADRKRGPRLGSALRPRDPTRTYSADEEPDYDPPGRPEPVVVRATVDNAVDFTRVQEVA